MTPLLAFLIMDKTPTPRTDKAAYYMGRKGPDRDGERWCDLLNESRAIERDLTAARDLMREAADSVHASLAETDISDSRREYREGLERRLRSLANVGRVATADGNQSNQTERNDT